MTVFISVAYLIISCFICMIHPKPESIGVHFIAEWIIGGILFGFILQWLAFRLDNKLHDKNAQFFSTRMRARKLHFLASLVIAASVAVMLRYLCLFK